MTITSLKVRSDSGKTYTISSVDGELHCTCPAFRFNPGEHCKHIRFAREQLLLQPAGA